MGEQIERSYNLKCYDSRAQSERWATCPAGCHREFRKRQGIQAQLGIKMSTMLILAVVCTRKQGRGEDLCACTYFTWSTTRNRRGKNSTHMIHTRHHTLDENAQGVCTAPGDFEHNLSVPQSRPRPKVCTRSICMLQGRAILRKYLSSTRPALRSLSKLLRMHGYDLRWARISSVSNIL